MQGFDLLRFYENGVVSMNLPMSAQVVGTRATRTTHPRVLAGFEQLFRQWPAAVSGGERFRLGDEGGCHQADLKHGLRGFDWRVG